jgi:endonuclease III
MSSVFTHAFYLMPHAFRLCLPFHGVNDVLMATTINKQRLLTHLFTAAKKRGEPEAESRPVLEQFIYGLCRENATREQADRAYRNLCEHFFDWNEVRVSSTRELEDAFKGLSEPEVRAQRLVSFLQEVFEIHFSFDLEKMQKEGLKQAAKKLARYQAANDYISSWVVQRSLGGHAIPLDPPTLRCSRRLGLIEDDQEEGDARASLEHLIPKAKGSLFTDLLSHLADEYCWADRPHCSGCPMSGECAYAQENGVEGLATTRSHRPKPR